MYDHVDIFIYGPRYCDVPPCSSLVRSRSEERAYSWSYGVLPLEILAFKTSSIVLIILLLVQRVVPSIRSDIPSLGASILVGDLA